MAKVPLASTACVQESAPVHLMPEERCDGFARGSEYGYELEKNSKQRYM